MHKRPAGNYKPIIFCRASHPQRETDRSDGMEKLKVQAIVTDGDGTLWPGSVAAYIGKRYLAWKLASADLHAFGNGLLGAKEVKGIIKEAGADGNAEAMRRFYEVLMSVGMGDERSMYRYASSYIARHRIGAVWELIGGVREGSTVILSTIGGSTSSRAAADQLGIDHIISNRDLFSGPDGRLTGIELRVRNGEEKRHEAMMLLDEREMDPSKCAAIGDSMGDVPTLMSVGLRYASPHATDDVKKVPGIRLLRR